MQEEIAGIPNTLPPQTYNGVLSLAASDFAAGGIGGIVAVLRK
jgi:hypothetical protein